MDGYITTHHAPPPQYSLSDAIRVNGAFMQAYSPSLRPGVSFRNVLLSPPIPVATKLSLTFRQAHTLNSRLHYVG